MSWLSNAWDHWSGKNAADDAQRAAQLLQQQQFASQQALAKQQQDFLTNQLTAAQGDEDRRAAEAAAAEARKREAIQGGNQSIDKVFAQFDEPYYQSYAKTFLDAQTPDIQHQYDLAKDKLTAQLAGRGTLSSSVGAAKFGELDRSKRSAETALSGQAQDAANELRNKVGASKTLLYKDVLGGADPNQISSRAVTDATSLANVGAVPAPPAQSLADLFGSVLAPAANATVAAINSPTKKLGINAAPLVGAGSSKIIG
jgi:hypothetical protein